MTTRARIVIATTTLCACVLVFLAARGCTAHRRLVEVFDNGPVGGPSGASEGYIWVGEGDLPPPGKSWKPTDPDTLTSEQRARIR